MSDRSIPSDANDSGLSDLQHTLEALHEEVARVVVGQRALVDGLLIALLADGHALVEGVPGLAKTTVIRTLARALGLGFGRIQFTPDLLPGDLTGNPVFVPDRRDFEVRKGPIFTPVLLADEINRAPAKVQSALLEAMEEGQVTIGNETLALPEPFFVMATQNPVELDGTYPLPEAQVDRFLVKLVVPYPSSAEELEITERDAAPAVDIHPVADAGGVRALRDRARKIHVAAEVARYAVDLSRATREQAPEAWEALRVEESPVVLGASPRASIFLVRAARARALLDGREYATPHDVKRVAKDVLRHRVVVSYEAEAEGIGADRVIDSVLERVEIP